ncbi:MAG: hypothetical protein GW859_07165 [Sphingomonadales bacterium]|nr:hypothetical protein [Sphingomonadales bacterium]
MEESIRGRGFATSAGRLPLSRDLYYPGKEEGGCGSGLSVRPSSEVTAGHIAGSAATLSVDRTKRSPIIAAGVAHPMVAAQSAVIFLHGALVSPVIAVMVSQSFIAGACIVVAMAGIATGTAAKATACPIRPAHAAISKTRRTKLRIGLI